MITALVAFNSTSFAQSSCAGITTGAFTTTPNGANDYYGIYVTLDRVYDQDVTVNVNFYPEGRPYINGNSVTVPAGELTVETAQNIAVPTGTAVFTEITNVSPSSVTADGVTCSTQGFAGGCSVNLAEQHNDALDFLHLNYQAGPYTLQDIYTASSNYASSTGKPLPNFSYNDMVYLKNNYATNVPGFITVMQSQYNLISVNEKNEMINLYQSLSATTNDNEVDGVLSNFKTSITQSSYTTIEKNNLLSISSALYTIGDFWSSTEVFMQSGGDAGNWRERASQPVTSIIQKNNQFVVHHKPLINQSFFSNANFKQSINEQPLNQRNLFQVAKSIENKQILRKRCRLFCVLCVAFNDAAMLVVTPNAITAAVWSAFTRCCGCGSCGAVGCS